MYSCVGSDVIIIIGVKLTTYIHSALTEKQCFYVWHRLSWSHNVSCGKALQIAANDFYRSKSFPPQLWHTQEQTILMAKLYINLWQAMVPCCPFPFVTSSSIFSTHCTGQNFSWPCLPWTCFWLDHLFSNKKAQLSLGKMCYSLYSSCCSTDLQRHPKSMIFISSEKAYAISH